jgi:hypothetical protein
MTIGPISRLPWQKALLAEMNRMLAEDDMAIMDYCVLVQLRDRLKGRIESELDDSQIQG